ncbi:hypothetical protein SPRG_04023 [Saprolegnia parasitica CBS 223.65]|uniref:Uncharacterized protein n=1 Tax=Saprolegnia parasitica (strain CBS 223.65) TaxID=695850 RepID=A0A067CX78_SAPPC|nr:hypothetical protein SPRG_04023 [Saprolegnia parasitica CBS 223.65]KDO31407.1 hypothetical protein SPRG_04023 [Saprolegnia parasitica CBS 223.65]|eukprot:XP_012198003.1 hypothetical protein SPRG_04023 [Saprolegnia parasitica CBS 223.65]
MVGAGEGKVFKRTRLGVVLPNLPEPVAVLERGKPLGVLQTELDDHQRKELDTILCNLQRRLDQALASLPTSQPLPRLREGEATSEVQFPWSAALVARKIADAVAAESDPDHPLTPLDTLTIALEVVQACFSDDDDGHRVHVGWTKLLAGLLDRMEAMLVRKAAKDRTQVASFVAAIGPEQAPSAPSPRAQLRELKLALASPRHRCSKPPSLAFELTDKAAYETRASARRLELPKVAPDNSYRHVRRCRAFPPTRVPEDEVIQRIYNYCPVESRFDLRSVSLNLHAMDSSKPWTVVEFPKARPPLSKDQVNYLFQWQRLRYEKLCTAQAMETECHAKLTLTLDYADAVMYELSRLLFDKCPTSSHFLYGLWHGVSSTMASMNKSIEDEIVVLSQTLKTLKVEVDQLERRHEQQRATMDVLHGKLQHKHKIVAAEKDLGIRLRNDLNKYLAADQILVRLTSQLVQTVLDAFPDQPRAAPRFCTGIEIVEELRRSLDAKFSLAHSDTFVRAFASASSEDAATHHGHSVLSSFEASAVSTELEAALKRLALLTTLSSPDCTLGWDPQLVWQHAFFIPPIQELLEMEGQLQELIATVESQSRAPVRRRCGRSAQTETAPLTAQSTGPRHIKQAVRMAATAHVVAPSLEQTPNKRLGDHKRTVPASFQHCVQHLRAEYVPYNYTVAATHRILSFVINEIILQLSSGASDGSKAQAPTELLALSPQDMVYRIFLERFRVPRFANERLVDLVTSLSHLDTQSEKIHLWSRLLGLAGVDALPRMAFWFALHALHVLAKVSHDGYYLVESDGGEFVGQQQAFDAMNIVLSHFSNDALQRAKAKVASLAQIYGTMWIPLYAVLAICVDEWEARYATTKLHIETSFGQAVDSFETFRTIVAGFNARAHPYAAASAYQAALRVAARPKPLHCSAACLECGVVPIEASALFEKTLLLFAAPSDGMLLQHADLTYALLKNVWAATSHEIVTGIERQTHLDSTAGLRLVTPLEHILRDEPLQGTHAWHLFHELLHIVHTPDVLV